MNSSVIATGSSPDVEKMPAGTTQRVLMVATSFPKSLADWRGLFIRHMADALNRQSGVQLSIWAPKGETELPSRWATTTDEARLLDDLMRLGGIAHLLRTHRLQGGWFALQLLRSLWNVYRRTEDIDIYHVNWLQNAIPLPDNGNPALITVLGSDMALLRLPLVQWLLRRVMRHRRVALCPNAGWPVLDLEARFGDLAVVRHIPLGIDARWFAVQRRAGHAHPDWLVISRVTRAKLGNLLAWCEPHFAHGQRTLHLIGPMQEQIALPPWVTFHGPADPDTIRNAWFPRVTGLITFSQHAEGRPQVLLEAMASGVPIVASNLPAHAELMETSGGGMICNSPEKLKDMLCLLETSEANRAIGQRGRHWVRCSVGTWDDCAARYMAVYHELLQRST